MEPHKTLGERGEDYATWYLKWRKGFKILERNFHAQGGEIDIICWNPKEKIHILVEVKTRKSQAFGDGLESIHEGKIRKMKITAVRYFLWKCKMEDVPEFEIHGMVLTPSRGASFFHRPFEVEYYDRLS